MKSQPGGWGRGLQGYHREVQVKGGESTEGDGAHERLGSMGRTDPNNPCTLPWQLHTPHLRPLQHRVAPLKPVANTHKHARTKFCPWLARERAA
jgi:hypothetical protein